MKRILAFILIFLMLFSFVSCTLSIGDIAKDVIGGDGYNCVWLFDNVVALIEGGVDEIIVPETAFGQPVTVLFPKKLINDYTSYIGAEMAKSPLDLVKNMWNQVKTDRKVKKIVISRNIETIPAFAFDEFSGLEWIEVDENNPHFKSVDGVLYSKDGETLIRYPMGRNVSSFSVPEGVKYIAPRAFCYAHNSIITNEGKLTLKEDTPLRAVNFPDSLIEIRQEAFCGSSVMEMVFPKNLSLVGNYAFNTCHKLEKIEFRGNTAIGTSAFFNCKRLSTVDLGNSVSRIGDDAFYCCELLTNISIPSSITNIGVNAFEKTGMLYYLYGGCLYLGNETNPYHALVHTARNERHYEVHKDTVVIASKAFNNDSVVSISVYGELRYVNDQAISDCYDFKTIYFSGTTYEWGLVAAGENVVDGTDSYTVHCSDGEITVSK